jgi:hypothetical protein
MPVIIQNQLGNANWDDVVTGAFSVKVDSVNPPTAVAYKGSQVWNFVHTADKKIYLTAQLPHGYTEGSDINFHIHFAIETNGLNGATAENVKFNFTHSWSNISGAIPGETTETATVDVKAYTTDVHYLLSIPATLISGANKNISSILLCSLTRDTAVANNYAHGVYFMSADFHIQKNSLGSNEQTAKAD